MIYPKGGFVLHMLRMMMQGQKGEDEKFIAMMRTGKRPDGTAVDKAMPFETLKAMNDTDLTAVHAYLKTLAPRALGSR